MDERLVSIDKIAKQAGVASSTLRYYERCGLIAEGIRVSGRRHYPVSVLERLSVIKCCQAIGFSLSEITDLLDGASGKDGAWRELAKARRADVQRQISQLHGLLELMDAALACSCHSLCDCPHMAPGGRLARRSPQRVLSTIGRWPSSPAV